MSRQTPVNQQPSAAPRADRQRRDRRFECLAGERRVAVQGVHRLLQQGPAAFRPHHDPRFDCTCFDHHRDLGGTIDQAKASVGDIVNPAAARQPNCMMDTSRGRRLQKIPTDAGVDQATDAAGIDVSGAERGARGLNTRTAGERSDGPHTPLPNSRHQLQPPLGQSQPLIKRLQSPLNVVAGPDFRWDFAADRLQANLFKTHAINLQTGIKVGVVPVRTSGSLQFSVGPHRENRERPRSAAQNASIECPC